MAERKISNGERKRGLLSGVGRLLGLGFLGCGVLTVGVVAWAQTAKDPGVRTGAAGAGSFQKTLTAAEKAFEAPGQGQFVQAFNVAGTNTCGTNQTCQSMFGLGPRF